MIATTYKPKKRTVQTQDLNFVPSYIQFYQWNIEKKEFKPSGTLHWNENQWEPFGNVDEHFFTMHHIVTTERTFGNNIYTSNDVDFYKPFYYIPSTGTKVEVGYAPPLFKQSSANRAVPDIADEIEEMLQ